MDLMEYQQDSTEYQEAVLEYQALCNTKDIL